MTIIYMYIENKLCKLIWYLTEIGYCEHNLLQFFLFSQHVWFWYQILIILTSDLKKIENEISFFPDLDGQWIRGKETMQGPLI